MSLQVDKSSYVVVDFDNGNVDIKVYITSTGGTSSDACAFDLTLVGGAKKQSQVFAKPKAVCNKSKLVSRKIELVRPCTGNRFDCGRDGAFFFAMVVRDVVTNECSPPCTDCNTSFLSFLM